MRYHAVATGGTFDHIHAGHRRLLEKSFEAGDRVVIGVTSDDFARKSGKVPDFHYDERVSQLEAYLKAGFPGREYTIAKLDDAFGPAVTSREIEAIVVSPESVNRVPRANELRAERGLPALEVVAIEFVKAEDGENISSTRIRGGAIDEEGRARR